MEIALNGLKRKVDQYRAVLQNTQAYRKVWEDSLRDFIIQQLQHLLDQVELHAKIDVREEMNNLQAVVISLGDSKSGIFQRINEEVERHLIKHHGSLIYQQLFNGKVIVIINYPFIENYGQPRPPKTIAIYRPEELREPFFLRHMEEFVTEITNWEDYDDDEPINRIGFNLHLPVPNEAQVAASNKAEQE